MTDTARSDPFGELLERLQGMEGWDCVVVLRRGAPRALGQRAARPEVPWKEAALRFVDQLRAGRIPGLKASPGLSTDWYRCYQAWCQRNGLRPAAQTKFTAALREAGVESRPQRFESAGAVSQRRVIDFGETPPDGGTRQEWLSEVVPSTASMIVRYRRRAHDSAAMEG